MNNINIINSKLFTFYSFYTVIYYTIQTQMHRIEFYQIIFMMTLHISNMRLNYSFM